jgi:protein-tyrosine-phosphatase
VFVCLHGAAKSVVAAAHFRREAAARGLAIDAVAAGTEPEPALAPAAVKGLAGEGLAPPRERPRMVTLHDVATATQVVTFGCDLSAWHPASPVTSWEEVPAVSDGYENARTAIAARIAALTGSLAGAARHG